MIRGTVNARLGAVVQPRRALGVQSLDEWCFEFDVTAVAPVPRPVIDALLDEAIGWAEARLLGVGGGYRPAAPEVAGAAMAWRFRFGLCVQAGGVLISESQAAELQELMRGWCESRELSFAGGFRAFTPAECGQDAEPSMASDVNN
jgi:hypothetical protein